MAVTFRRHSFSVIRVIALGLMFVACDKKSLPPTTPPSPSVPGVLIRLELIGPVPFQIAPGATVQLKLDAFRSDGSVENVTNKARWSTSDAQVLDVGPTGLATGRDRGMAVVRVAFEGREVARAFSVMPQGTFRLFGTIRESGAPVPNVSVTVVSGVGDGLATLSDRNGDYSLYGVSGPVQLTLRKEAYLTTTHTVNVTAPLRSDVSLVAERPRKDYTGAYTLTISAGSPCATSPTLPDDAKRRIYTANVGQDAGRLTVTLTGADFIVSNGSGNRFFGFVDLSDVLTFSIGEWDYYVPVRFDIVERFQDTALIVFGIVTARGTPQGISGTLAGAIMISTLASAPFFPLKTECSSSAHTFEMVRR